MKWELTDAHVNDEGNRWCVRKESGRTPADATEGLEREKSQTSEQRIFLVVSVRSQTQGRALKKTHLSLVWRGKALAATQGCSAAHANGGLDDTIIALRPALAVDQPVGIH